MVKVNKTNISNNNKWIYNHLSDVIDYLDSCFHYVITLFFDLNQLIMKAEVEFVYHILNFLVELYMSIIT